MTGNALAHQGARCLAEAMATERKIGRHTYRRLTDEEARQEFGSSFVFVGRPKLSTYATELLKEADAALEQLHAMRLSEAKHKSD